MIALKGGGYVVSFSGYKGPNDSYGRNAFVVLDENGKEISSVLTPSFNGNGGEAYASLLALSDGGFAMTWAAGLSVAGGINPLYMRFFDKTGAPDGQRKKLDADVDTLPYIAPTLVETDTGVRAVYVDSEGLDKFLTTVDVTRAGQITGRDKLDIDTFLPTPSVEQLSNGKFVIATGTGNGGITRIVTKPNGTLIEGERIDLLVDTFSTRNNATDPIVEQLASGNYLIAWQDGGYEAGSFSGSGGIWGQRFDAQGDMIGTRYLLSDTRVTDSLDLAATASGGFLMTWEERDDRFDGNSPYIAHAQEFGPTGRAIGQEITLPTGRTDTNNTPPLIAVQTDGTALAVLGTIGNGYREAVVRKLELADLPDFAGPIKGNGKANVLNGADGVDDIIIGKAGNDRLTGGRGHDDLFGDKGKDALFGGRGHDVLDGGRGNDTLKGGKGDDVLIGGAGENKMFGGAGADIFVFRKGAFGQDNTIKDFEIGVDSIEVTGFGPSGSPTPLQTITAGGLLLEWDINSPDPDASILLSSISQTLGRSDFLFV